MVANTRLTRSVGFAVALLLLSVLGGCATAPPSSPDNLCEIFDEKEDWYEAAMDVEKRWKVPPYVTLAIIHQESRFLAKAKPPRTKILWFIPGPRPSTAYGYAQALDTTWDEYVRDTGNWGADRDEFEDAADFVGWYSNLSYKRNRIRRDDAYSLYLAYHEGHGGFSRKTYRNKDWLLRVSRKVQRRTAMYRQQYAGCRDRLKQSGWFGWF